MLKHIDLLSYTELQCFVSMRNEFAAPSLKSKRNTKVVSLEIAFQQIKDFEDNAGNAENKWKRCLVCGICFFDNSIALNIPQLSKVIFKGRSSINSGLKMMGYNANTIMASECKELLDAIPILNTNIIECRLWTVRHKTKSSESKPPQIDDSFQEFDFDFFE